MSSNPASETLNDPLEYYTNQSKRKRSVHRISQPDLRGITVTPTVKSADVVGIQADKRHGSRAMDAWLSFLRCVENIPVLGHGLSAIYMCTGSKDKAERAGLKATVGILCCICNFPVEIIDEATSKPSLKLDSPALMQRPDWMRHHSKRQLRQLCLPGSHQSATYKMHKLKQIPFIEGWSRCQKLSIDAQLYGGVRFFDLRVMAYDGTIWVHHNLVACVPLREVLECVRDFVAERATEIVGVHFDADGKPVDWGLCQSLIHETLGEKLIHEHMSTMLVGDIVDQGRNVFVMGVPHVAYCWRNVQNRWPNKSWPHELHEDMESTLSEVTVNPPANLYWYKAECTPNTPMIVRNIGGVPGYAFKSRGGHEKFEFVEDMAFAANHVVYNILCGLSRIPFSVLSTDYVQDDIVGLIIELNDKAAEGMFTAEESAELAEDVFTETSSLVTAPPRGRSNQKQSTSSIAASASSLTAANTSFDIRLKPPQLLEIKETNM